MKISRYLKFTCLALIIAGCATGQMNWDSRIGVTTYDQAVSELGPPTRQNKLSDGRTVAEWISRYTYGAYNPVMDDNFYNSAASFSPTLRERQLQESTLSLTFDTNNILTDWSKD